MLHQEIFISRKIDPVTGLYYFNARWYDPTMGRFITEDPIKDGSNWHTYCMNNPLRFIDPTGLKNTQEGMNDAGYDNNENYDQGKDSYRTSYNSYMINNGYSYGGGYTSTRPSFDLNTYDNYLKTIQMRILMLF